MASLSPLPVSDTESESEPESEPESLTPLLEGGTSSTSSLLGDADTSTSSDATPRVNRLKSVWRSPVWNFYSLAEDTKFAVCSKCGDLVSRGGESTKSYNTSNLVSHLRSQHSEEYINFTKLKVSRESERETVRKERGKTSSIGGLRQLTLAGRCASEKVKQWDINDSKSTLLHKKLGEMMALDCQPITIVEDIGFNCFVNALEPRYAIPSRKYFTEKVIPNIYAGMKVELMKKVHSPGVMAYSFTTDVWSTTSAGESLLSLTAHWVQGNFVRASAVLHVTTLEGSHTGENIAGKIEDMLLSWRISKENVHLFLRDNAANMERAMKDAGVVSFGCFAHSLQLVVHDGVLSQRGVSDLLSLCRTIVGHFKRSTKATDKLKEIQQNLGLPAHSLKQDEATRWNSSLEMLKSVVEQKMALAAYATEGSIPVLTTSNLEIADKVITVLSPIEEITKNVSKDCASISLIIPLVRALTKKLEQSDDDIGVRGMKRAMLLSLQRRFTDIEKTNFLVLSTLLDPRFKDRSFSTSVFRQNAVTLLKSHYIVEVEDCQIEEPASKRSATDSRPIARGSVWGCLNEILMDDTLNDDTNVSSESEVEQYLAVPIINFKRNPFEWWEINQKQYPVLAKLGKKYLSAPPTSVNSERVFSGAGLLYTDHRCRLQPELAEKLLLIKYNYPSVGSSYVYKRTV